MFLLIKQIRFLTYSSIVIQTFFQSLKFFISLNQLSYPNSIYVEIDSLIIYDYWNKQVFRWPHKFWLNGYKRNNCSRWNWWYFIVLFLNDILKLHDFFLQNFNVYKRNTLRINESNLKGHSAEIQNIFLETIAVATG